MTSSNRITEINIEGQIKQEIQLEMEVPIGTLSKASRSVSRNQGGLLENSPADFPEGFPEKWPEGFLDNFPECLPEGFPGA